MVPSVTGQPCPNRPIAFFEVEDAGTGPAPGPASLKFIACPQSCKNFPGIGDQIIGLRAGDIFTSLRLAFVNK